MYGITFNGKHSLRDLGLYAENKIINAPPKKKITDSVPFMHGVYDFSTIGSNGEQVFDLRTVTVTLRIIAYSVEEVHTVYGQALEWLMDYGEHELVFDFMPDFYFMAEVQDAPDWDKFLRYGLLSVDFICRPFKIGTSYVGDDIWDTFNFITDYTMYTNIFTVDNAALFEVYNPGRPISPVLNVNTPMKFIFEGSDTIHQLATGDNKIYEFKLKTGLNNIGFEVIDAGVIGTAKVIFRKESL